MKRKVITGIAALTLCAALPVTAAVTVFADENNQQPAPSQIEGEQKEERKEMPQQMKQEGEMPEFNGELPEPPEGEMPEFNGELPEPPEGMPEFNGELPEPPEGMPEFNGELPEPPEGMPEFNGELPELPEGEMPGRPGFSRRRMPRKSDEEAMAEGNPAPELPEDISEDELKG